MSEPIDYVIDEGYINFAARVCSTCNDTHQMPFGGDGDRRMVMCTRCPTPCQHCRAGGNGPYCENTPCSCVCHAQPQEPDRG